VINIIKCDYENPKHTNAVKLLLNAYIADEMGDGTVLDEKTGDTLIKKLNSHERAIVLLAKDGDEFIGLLTAFENIATFKAKPMINVHDIIVLKEYRGRGAGRRLMNAVVVEAKKRECARITLEVREDNAAARNLYKSMDFKQTQPKMLYLRREL
jgi:ribosomal protein S18 acetylase RimI-like enzyme